MCPTDPISSRPASPPWSSIYRGAGSWARGPKPPSGAGRRSAEAERWGVPPRARSNGAPRRRNHAVCPLPQSLQQAGATRTRDVTRDPPVESWGGFQPTTCSPPASGAGSPRLRRPMLKMPARRADRLGAPFSGPVPESASPDAGLLRDAVYAPRVVPRWPGSRKNRPRVAPAEEASPQPPVARSAMTAPPRGTLQAKTAPSRTETTRRSVAERPNQPERIHRAAASPAPARMPARTVRDGPKSGPRSPRGVRPAGEPVLPPRQAALQTRRARPTTPAQIAARQPDLWPPSPTPADSSAP
jgi:hypothetical protein